MALEVKLQRSAVDAILGKGREGIHVEPNAEYYGLLDEVTGEVVAIGSLECRGSVAVLSMDYVLPSHRRQGLHGQLIDLRIKVARSRGVVVRAKATCLKSSVRNYLRRGFAVTRQYKHGWGVVLDL